MRTSRYNMFWTLEDGTRIAFNSMTCALAEINDDFIDMLNNIDSIRYEELDDEKKQLFDAMLEGNYIIRDDFNEIKAVKYRHFSGKFNTDSLGLTIAPTLSCNFACPYCYESPKKGMMSEEIQQHILEFVSEAARKRKDISITWYGGEPLLAKDIIFGMAEKMIKLCEENGCNYSSYMVTNGYLLNDEIIQGFKKAKISGAQITLDGPPEIHNRRRIPKGDTKGTFDLILNNIKKMRDNDLRVNIRVNVDKSNIDQVQELLDILKANGLEGIDVGLGHVTAYTEACTSIVESCMNTEEYAMNNVRYQQILHDKGFYSTGYPYYPGIKANYCCADSVSAFVVDPEGYMYKCWNDVGTVDRAVGHVSKIKENPDEAMYIRNVNYILWSPFDFQECLDCNILPICMGGCPYNGWRNGLKPDCEKWKYNLEDVLKLTYTQKKDCPEECTSNECNCG